jgi:hypothetical protein
VLQWLKTDQLPALSIANVRLLLPAVMPLQRLNVKQATDWIAEHVLNRSSRKSRLKQQHLAKQSTFQQSSAQM